MQATPSAGTPIPGGTAVVIEGGDRAAVMRALEGMARRAGEPWPFDGRVVDSDGVPAGGTLVVVLGDGALPHPRELFLLEGPSSFPVILPDVHGFARPGPTGDVVDILAERYRLDGSGLDPLDMVRERMIDDVCRQAMLDDAVPQHEQKGFYRKFEKRRPGGGLSRGKRRR